MASLPATGHRVSLRRLREEDLTNFQSYRLDPVVGRYQGWAATSDDEARAFLIAMSTSPAFPAGEWFQLAIAERQSDTLIGDIGVCVAGDGAEAEIGFTLSRPFQGKGLAREAVQLALMVVFLSTEVNRVFAITDARNIAANNLLHALGLTRVESKAAIFRNEACIEYTYAIARHSGA